MALGSVLLYKEDFSALERMYIKIFGVPVNGLQIRARRVLPLINSKYKNILDAGCGPGIFTFEIAKKCPTSNVVGIDIDESEVSYNRDIANKIGQYNCIFEVKDISKLDYYEKFDLILSVDNLEHLEDDLGALKLFNKSLMKNGELILHVPGLYRRWLFFGWAENFYIEGHFRPGYTIDEISMKVREAGFEIIDSYYTYGWLETITNNISYWITKAQMKNKILYALVFPVLNVVSFLGRNSKPLKGAGVLIKAKKN